MSTGSVLHASWPWPGGEMTVEEHKEKHSVPTFNCLVRLELWPITWASECCPFLLQVGDILAPVSWLPGNHSGLTGSRNKRIEKLTGSSHAFKNEIPNSLFVLSEVNQLVKMPYGISWVRKSEEKDCLLWCNQIPQNLIPYPIYGWASHSKLKWTFHPCVS